MTFPAKIAQWLKQDTMGARAWLCLFGGCLGACLLAAFLVLLPYSFWWLHACGDAAVERAVATQALGRFALFGSGLSQDFIEYKLRLYEAVRPQVIAIGSSRVMQFRGAWFSRPFVNMGGVAGNLGELELTLRGILKAGRPQAIILGVDFWWFLPQWQENPEEPVRHVSGTYNYALNSLKKPWQWLFDGKISAGEFLAPFTGIFGRGFAADRFGIMAQQTSNGFGPDGSWYYTAEVTGQKPSPDYQFRDTLTQVTRGIKAFYHARSGQSGPAMEHLDVFADICCRLKSRGIRLFVFIPPLAQKVYEAIKSREEAYPHLFKLRHALQARGIDTMDFSNPGSLGSNDCEFVDGFHGGEVTYARILRQMAEHWPALLPYVNMEKIDAVIRDWSGHAMTPDERLTFAPETDFMNAGCRKRSPRQ